MRRDRGLRQPGRAREVRSAASSRAWSLLSPAVGGGVAPPPLASVSTRSCGSAGLMQDPRGGEQQAAAYGGIEGPAIDDGERLLDRCGGLRGAADAQLSAREELERRRLDRVRLAVEPPLKLERAGGVADDLVERAELPGLEGQVVAEDLELGAVRPERALADGEGPEVRSRASVVPSELAVGAPEVVERREQRDVLAAEGALFERERLAQQREPAFDSPGTDVGLAEVRQDRGDGRVTGAEQGPVAGECRFDLWFGLGELALREEREPQVAHADGEVGLRELRGFAAHLDGVAVEAFCGLVVVLDAGDRPAVIEQAGGEDHIALERPDRGLGVADPRASVGGPAPLHAVEPHESHRELGV
jgi:hypothetical protein